MAGKVREIVAAVLVLLAIALALAWCVSCGRGASVLRNTNPLVEPWEPLMASCALPRPGVVECDREQFFQAGLGCIELGRQHEHCRGDLEECRALANVNLSECHGNLDDCVRARDKAKTSRWWYAGGGVALGVLLSLLCGFAL